jgi:hypothetical protein
MNIWKKLKSIKIDMTGMYNIIKHPNTPIVELKDSIRPAVYDIEDLVNISQGLHGESKAELMNYYKREALIDDSETAVKQYEKMIDMGYRLIPDNEELDDIAKEVIKTFNESGQSTFTGRAMSLAVKLYCNHLRNRGY